MKKLPAKPPLFTLPLGRVTPRAKKPAVYSVAWVAEQRKQELKKKAEAPAPEPEPPKPPPVVRKLCEVSVSRCEEGLKQVSCEKKEILVMNSPHKQCGVREYGVELTAHLAQLGAKVKEVRLQDLQELSTADRVLLHVEPSLLPPGFDAAVRAATERGAQIVVCCHAFTEELLRRFHYTSAVVVHRDYGVRHPKLHQIPLGCPVYEPTSSPQALRQRYGLPLRATVITTFGFLSAWKMFPETAHALLQLLPPGMFLQFLCSPHFVRYEKGEHLLKEIAKNSPNLQLRTDFLPGKEILERLYASDLGFVFHNQNTGSVSAATKQFVSARCPLVVTASSHASDMLGASRGPIELKAFAQHVVDVAKNKQELQALKKASVQEYQRLNMRKVAGQYLQLFSSL